MEGVLRCHVLFIKMDSCIHLMWTFIEQNVRRKIHTHARVPNVHCVKSFRTQIDKAYNSDTQPPTTYETTLCCSNMGNAAFVDPKRATLSRWNTPLKMSAYYICMGTKLTCQGQGSKSHDVAQERLGQLVRSRTQDPNSLGSIPDRVFRRSFEQHFYSTQTSSRWKPSNQVKNLRLRNDIDGR